jgi:hypothetical protein
LAVVKKLIRPQNVNVDEDELQKFHSGELINFFKIFKISTGIKLSEIKLEEKKEEEININSNTIAQDLITTYKRNKTSTIQKSKRSSVAQFLIDHNFKKDTLDKEKLDCLDSSKPPERLSKLATFQDPKLPEKSPVISLSNHGYSEAQEYPKK